MGTRVAESGRSPWGRREAAMRRLGPIRREVAERAVSGSLPTEEQVALYRERQAEFDAAHAAWLASRPSA